jgi:hypothetical protein
MSFNNYIIQFDTNIDNVENTLNSTSEVETFSEEKERKYDIIDIDTGQSIRLSSVIGCISFTVITITFLVLMGIGY